MLQPERYAISVSGNAGTDLVDTASHVLELPIAIFLLKKQLRQEGVKNCVVLDTKTTTFLSKKEIYVEEHED